jgi:DegV family protein with EDD domain
LNIRFVVDSGCDVPDDLARQYNMAVVPLYVNYDGQSYADESGTFDRTAYYDKLASIQPIPQTSAPSPAIAQKIVQEASETADHLICVSIAEKLSASNNVLRMAIETLPPGKATLWDSETLSMGGGWQAILGAQTAQETGDVQTVLDTMRRVRQSTTVYASMANLTYLIRGGRVGWAQGMVGNLLRIRPIVRVKDGEVNSAARLRTQKAWVKRTASLTEELGKLSHLAFIHTNNLPDIENLRNLLHDRLPETQLTVTASPTIGTHTGPYGIGVAAVRETWKD